jgi:DNA modification methylase
MTPYWHDDHLTVYQGDAREVLRELPDESVHCVVTSPPYWGLRDYGVAGQLGLEATPEEYVAALVDVFREVRRVLRADGTVWLNLGDSYATSNASESSNGHPSRHRKGLPQEPSVIVPRSSGGLKPKDLVGIPWRVAFALQADGWYLRSDIIWSKPNPMPESVTDRPTKSHEYLFLLSKSARYFYDTEAVLEAVQSGPSDIRKMTEGRDRIGGLVKESTDRKMAASGLTNVGQKRSVGNPAGRNLRSVWTIATQPYPGAHFATFPQKLVEPCVKAGCPEGGTVLDPFAGSGTTGLVAQHLGRRAVLIDLSGDYLVQCLERNRQVPMGLGA